METLDRVEQLIVAGSEGFFDEPDIRNDLHVTIHIARDFYDFLIKYGDRPPAKEVAYVMDTIRSGIDEFSDLAYLCGVINAGPDTWEFEPFAHWDFRELRERFIRGFQNFTASSSDRSVLDRLASLLALTHLELVFFGRYFPLAILEDTAVDPQSNAEFISDLSEWHAGRLTFDEVKSRALARDKHTP
ncbi:MAG TPA: hypothetical protein VJQ82_00860 [Terriglobales bacterium]|nr:hypothetical protein [Terriglobales bacterium]